MGANPVSEAVFNDDTDMHLAAATTPAMFPTPYFGRRAYHDRDRRPRPCNVCGLKVWDRITKYYSLMVA
jgi:hypothetical protein